MTIPRLDRLSVVIPTYNGRAFLGEAIASVALQTLLPGELIVVDDASTDGTPELVEGLAAEMPFPVRLIRLPSNSGGPARPTNVGIEAANGELVALLDHDDRMMGEKLAAQCEVLETCSEVEIVLTDYTAFDATGTIPETGARDLFPEAHAMLLLKAGAVNLIDSARGLMAIVTGWGLAMSCSNYLFRKACWKRIGGFDPRCGPTSDYDFLLRTFERPVAWIDRVLFAKRRHEGNLWVRSKENYLSILRTQREAVARFPENRELADRVAGQIRTSAQHLRWLGCHGASFQAACRLFAQGHPGAAMVECSKTSAAAIRDLFRRPAVGHASSGQTENRIR